MLRILKAKKNFSLKLFKKGKLKVEMTNGNLEMELLSCPADSDQVSEVKHTQN